jgi:hypothetical protein
MITLLTSQGQYEWGFEEEYGMKQACSYPPRTGAHIQDLCELTDCKYTNHSLQFSNLILPLLQAVISSEGLASIFLQLCLSVRERHGTNVVGPGDLRVGSIGLQGLQNDLQFELGAVRTIANGTVGLVGLQEPKPSAIQPRS